MEYEEKSTEELKTIESDVQGHIIARESQDILAVQIESLVAMYLKGGGKLEDLTLE